MSLGISTMENFNKGWKRNVREECELAIAEINNNAGSNPHEVIHEVRKSFKKVRAALRLVRHHIDYYRQENIFFRDQGRKISDIRDATSIIEALDLLKKQFDSNLYEHTFQSVRNLLVERREQMAKEQLERQKVLQQIASDLKKKVTEFDSWQLETKGFDTPGKGMHKTYKRGWNAMQKADQTRSTEDFHEWRKRAKYLRYHFRLLDFIWTDVMETLEDELHDITDYIGMDHDLAVLHTVVDQENLEFKDEEARQTFFGLLNHKRKQLQEHAILKGKKWYVDDPDVFVSRIEKFWNTHQEKIRNHHLISEDSLEV